MQYRKFGRLDWEVSAASLGILRVETVVREDDGIDWDERAKAAAYAFDSGVNFVNLGYPTYFRDSETAFSFGRKVLGLAGGRAKTAVNVLTRDIQSQADLDRCLDMQLENLSLDKADFCVLDWVYRRTWEKLKRLDVASWAERILKDGRAGHMGIMFHDDAYYLDDINSTYSGWDLVQFEYSFMDHKHHPGAGGKKYTAQFNQGLVASDCMKGGRLLENIPENVRNVWDEAEGDLSVAERCIRWTLSQAEVATVLFDLETVGQAKEYLETARKCIPGSADMFEVLAADFSKDAYYSNRMIQCSACRCCMPCGFDVDAPRIAELYNDALMFRDARIPGFLYNLEGHANVPCKKCALCEKRCPRSFPLVDLMERAGELFAD